MATHDPTLEPWFLLYLAVLLVISLGLTYESARDGRKRSNVYLLVSATFASLLALEAFFLNFKQSDVFAFTYASANWFRTYFVPVNSHGYRDGEWPKTPRDGDNMVLFVGDSFVAGHGIEDRQERFPEVTASRLSSGWQSIVLAQCGWGPLEEERALREFPHQARAVVLSWTESDIGDAGGECGKRVDSSVSRPSSKLVDLLVKNSFFLNYVYWRVWRMFHRSFGERYWSSVMAAFGDSSCWDAHGKQLQALIRTARTKAPLVVAVVFPMLGKIEDSQPIVRRVADFYRDNGVFVIDVSVFARALPLKERIVNRFDTHPGRVLHRELGRVLAEQIRTLVQDATGQTVMQLRQGPLLWTPGQTVESTHGS